MKQGKFNIHKRLQSFTFAFNGLKIIIKEEHNSRIHMVSGAIALFMGILLHISSLEWIAIVLSIGLVFTLEIINSSIENVIDFISVEKHEKTKRIKDLSAAGVLVSSFVAFIIGLIIFIPKLLHLC